MHVVFSKHWNSMQAQTSVYKPQVKNNEYQSEIIIFSLLIQLLTVLRYCSVIVIIAFLLFAYLSSQASMVKHNDRHNVYLLLTSALHRQTYREITFKRMFVFSGFSDCAVFMTFRYLTYFCILVESQNVALSFLHFADWFVFKLYTYLPTYSYLYFSQSFLRYVWVLLI